MFGIFWDTCRQVRFAAALLASLWQERLVEATKSKELGNARFKAPKDLSGRTYFLLELPLACCARLEASKMPFVHIWMPSIFWATRLEGAMVGMLLNARLERHCRLYPAIWPTQCHGQTLQGVCNLPASIILSDLRQIATKELKMDFGQIHFVAASVLFLGLCIPEPTEPRCRGEKSVSHGPSSCSSQKRREGWVDWGLEIIRSLIFRYGRTFKLASTSNMRCGWTDSLKDLDIFQVALSS